MRTMPWVVAVLATAGLFGCSDQDAGEVPRVASFQTRPTAQATAAAERPVIPVDATDEERAAFVEAWMACVRKAGGPEYRDPRDVDRFERAGDATAKQVRATCQAKEPETYEERQKRTDVAAFRDNQRQWYRCAQQAGYRLTKPDENGEFGLTEVGPQGDFQSAEIEACRREAFRR